MNFSAPVVMLTLIGAIVAVLGLFAAGNVVLVAIGILAIFGAGVLQVLGQRRS